MKKTYAKFDVKSRLAQEFISINSADLIFSQEKIFCSSLIQSEFFEKQCSNKQKGYLLLHPYYWITIIGKVFAVGGNIKLIFFQIFVNPSMLQRYVRNLLEHFLNCYCRSVLAKGLGRLLNKNPFSTII